MTTKPGSNPRIDAEASQWLVRHVSGELAANERDHFQQWLAADPRHQKAWQESWFAWEDMSQMTYLAESELLESVTFREKLAAFVLRPFSAGGRTFQYAAYASMLLLAVLAAGFWSVKPLHTTSSGFAELYSTRIAQIREYQFPDGSELILGAKSSVGWQADKEERRVTLLEGEAYFAVAKDPARPFIVQVNNTQIRVLGTEFDVHRGPKMVRVSVSEGLVEVSRLDAGEENTELQNVRQLHAGQQITSVYANPLGTIENIGINQADHWRNGRLVYEEVTLDEVIADANRYYDGEIQFASDELRRLKITASFQTTEIDQFINTLLEALPVRVARPKPGRIVLW